MHEMDRWEDDGGFVPPVEHTPTDAEIAAALWAYACSLPPQHLTPYLTGMSISPSETWSNMGMDYIDSAIPVVNHD